MELLWPILHNPITWWIGGITGAILLYVAFAFVVVPPEVRNAPKYGSSIPYRGDVKTIVFFLYRDDGGAAPFQSLQGWKYDLTGPWAAAHWAHASAFQRNGITQLTIQEQGIVNAAAEGHPCA